jgi:hypothetical protein
MAIRFGGNLGFNKRIGGVNLGVNLPFGDSGVNTARVGKSGKTQDNSINRIITHVSESGGFSKPTLYKIQITPPGGLKDWVSDVKTMRHIAFNCDSIGMPGRNIATKANKTYGLKKEYAYDKIHQELTATFYVSEGLEEFQFFEAWTDLMFDADGNVGWYNDYAQGTVIIHQLSNKDGKVTDVNDLGVIASCILYEAYPKTISPLRLGYALGNQVQRLDVSFTFRDAETFYHQSEKTSERTLSPLSKVSSFFQNFSINGSIPLGNNFRVGTGSAINRNRSIF